MGISRKPPSIRVLVLPALLLLAGLTLMGLNAREPRMLKADWLTQVKPDDSEAYFREYDRNLNPRARHFDLGAGLASMSAALLALLAVTRSWSVRRVRALQTPRRRATLFLLANVAWLYYCWASAQFLIVQQQREEFPPWADSILIPLAGMRILGVVMLVVINAALFVYLHGAKLPAAMWARPRGANAWALNVVAGVVLLGSVLAGCDAVWEGDVFTPPGIVAIIYLLLVGRAASSAK